MERQRPRPDFAADTAGQLQPSYEIAQRMVGRLAVGDLLLEPIFGPVRIAGLGDAGYDEQRHVPLRQVVWIDDDGVSWAARSYPVDVQVPVRIPALTDCLRIRQGLDQARYHRQELDDDTARLIAAHLSLGAGSALYGFAVSGAITERLHQELHDAEIKRSAVVQRWARALGGYCLSRADNSPTPGWASERW